ncbi:MAG: TonB family protein [Burkholderiaceae bacterium]|jgi:colicin import membrane protein|nr:TonB family protein [Burkholderiaceae bacterium]
MKQESGLYFIPKESKTKQSLILALFVHMALLAFLWIGVSWKNDQGEMAEAEVWDIKVRDAAPVATAPEPVAEEAPPEKPAVPPEPVKETVEEKPDIALEQEKKRKEEKRKEEQRKEEQRKEEKKKAEAKKKEEQKAKQLKRADQQKANAIMAEEARRLAAKSGTGGSGTSPYSTGSGRADAGYSRKVGAKIKSNTVFNVPEGLSGNPPVEYEVQLLPDGSVRGIKKRKSSGVPGFDEAVQRAIERSAPYPQDQSGRMPSGFILSHKPKG